MPRGGREGNEGEAGNRIGWGGEREPLLKKGDSLVPCRTVGNGKRRLNNLIQPPDYRCRFSTTSISMGAFVATNSRPSSSLTTRITVPFCVSPLIFFQP